MKNLVGHEQIFDFIVDENMSAIFDQQLIHPVLSTFWLSYYFEYFSRLMIQPYFLPEHNACGAELVVKHHAPAFPADKVSVTIRVTHQTEKFINCEIVACVGERKIATGFTMQYIADQRFFNNHFKKGPNHD